MVKRVGELLPTVSPYQNQRAQFDRAQYQWAQYQRVQNERTQNKQAMVPLGGAPIAARPPRAARRSGKTGRVKEPRAGATTLIFALATWVGMFQAADAWSPHHRAAHAKRAPVTADESLPSPDAGVHAHGSRHHHLWRHLAHHHRHQREEMEADVAPAETAPKAEAIAPTAAVAPQAMPPQSSTLQLVVSTKDGGDPFEELMTAYYWSRLNHAIPSDQVFEPTRRYAEDTQPIDLPRGPGRR